MEFPFTFIGLEVGQTDEEPSENNLEFRTGGRHEERNDQFEGRRGGGEMESLLRAMAMTIIFNKQDKLVN